MTYMNSKDNIVKELSNKGLLKNNLQINIYYCVIKIFTSILLILVLVSSLGVIKF